MRADQQRRCRQPHCRVAGLLGVAGICQVVDRVLGVTAGTALFEEIGADIRQKLTPHCAGQPDIDIVPAGLDAKAGFARQACKCRLDRVRRVEAGDCAPIMLMALVAVRLVAQKVGEVVEQVEVASGNVEIGPGGTTFVGLDPLPGNRKSARIAAVGRVEGLIKPPALPK